MPKVTQTQAIVSSVHHTVQFVLDPHKLKLLLPIRKQASEDK